MAVKVVVCCRSITGIEVLNPVGDMAVVSSCLLCVV